MGLIRLAVIAMLLVSACQPTASPAETSGSPSAPHVSTGPTRSGVGSAPPSMIGAPDCMIGSLSPDLFATMTVAQPAVKLPNAYCVVVWTLFMSEVADGTAIVRAGSDVLLIIDVANFAAIGTEGAGSGERDVAVSPALGVPALAEILLEVTDCMGCDSLTVTINAASR